MKQTRGTNYFSSFPGSSPQPSGFFLVFTMYTVIRKTVIITQVTGSVAQIPTNPNEGINHRAAMIFISSSMMLEITGAAFLRYTQAPARMPETA